MALAYSGASQACDLSNRLEDAHSLIQMAIGQASMFTGRDNPLGRELPIFLVRQAQLFSQRRMHSRALRLLREALLAVEDYTGMEAQADPGSQHIYEQMAGVCKKLAARVKATRVVTSPGYFKRAAILSVV